MNRRRFLPAIGGGWLAACGARRSGAAAGVRLAARPASHAVAIEPGIHSLGIGRERDALLYVPEMAVRDRPLPLVVYLHGATGSPQQGRSRLGALADQFGTLLLSPGSEGTTWDAIRGGYGRDVETIDAALKRTFETCRVDPRRVAVCGFSDGASYALGLGISNGDLFRAVMAFSPGFIPAGIQRQGNPRLFVSHGTNDTILPIESCSRRLVPELKRAGYRVKYREFEGPHTLPREVAEEAFRWFLA